MKACSVYSAQVVDAATSIETEAEMQEAQLPKILQMMDDISRVVNSLEDSQQVLDSLVKLVTGTMGVANCSLMLIDPATNTLQIKASQGLDENIARSYRGKIGEGIAGWVAARGEALLIPDIDKDPRFPTRPAEGRERYQTRSLLSVPLVLSEQVVGVLNVNNKIEGGSFEPSDQAVLQVVARFVTSALEKAQMREIVAQKERLDSELQAARRIQEIMLPREFPHDKNVEIAAQNIAAAKVAGDFYDVIAAPDGLLWLIIGDVCSKGLPSALYMARVLSYFRVVSGYQRSPSGLLREVNNLLTRENTDVTFATVCVLMLDKQRESVAVTTAGHPAPLFFRGDKEPVSPLEAVGGPPLGVEADVNFEERVVPFRPGQLLLGYTDGVTEARNKAGRLFGVNRLRSVIRSHHLACNELLDAVVGAVRGFAVTKDVQDDLTLIAVRKRPVG